MSDSTHEPNRQIANALRVLRNGRGWSLDRTAQETGVSKAMLGQIERCESSPTIATLWKIASGFQTSLSSLIEPAPVGSPDAVLFPYAPPFGFELFELTLLPGYERLSEAHEPGVTEHVIVLRGPMEVLVEGEWIELGEGEAVRFAADRPHGYRNRRETPAVFHNLIHYAQTAGSGVLVGDQPRI